MKDLVSLISMKYKKLRSGTAWRLNLTGAWKFSPLFILKSEWVEYKPANRTLKFEFEKDEIHKRSLPFQAVSLSFFLILESSFRYGNVSLSFIGFK